MFTVLVIVGVISVLWVNNGRFTYTLDDPYIQLAVAEELAIHGHYGVNSHDFSAPCSSPLWPVLMVPFAKLPGFELIPLIISWLAGLITIWILHQRVEISLPETPNGKSLKWLRIGLSGFVILGFNLIGLVFTGMEHSLQVLLTIIVVDGMLKISENRKAGFWFTVAMIAGPWIRYENMALTAVGACYLMHQKRYLQAIMLGGFALAGLTAFSGYLVSLGLDPVPASIQTKSAFAAGGKTIATAKTNLIASITYGRGLLVALLSAVLYSLTFTRIHREKWKPVARLIAAAGCMHLIAGSYGWMNRYEIYILLAQITCMIGIVGVLVKDCRHLLENRHVRVLAPLLPVVGFPYLLDLLRLPVTANNIYEQHYQMHRFVVEYWKKPVGVNDLGYVSFRNPQYVLDLWGLASVEALHYRLNATNPDWMQTLTTKKGVQLVMIYDHWFPKLPAQWKKIADISLSKPCIAPGGAYVSFYVTNEGALTDAIPALEKFQKSLPQDVCMKIFTP